MSRPNPSQSFTHCWRYARRRAVADGDAFHIVLTSMGDSPRLVLTDRALFARDDLATEDIEATIDPFLLGFSALGREERPLAGNGPSMVLAEQPLKQKGR